MNFQNWLYTAINHLKQSERPRRDAEILLGFVTGRTRSWILAFGETILTDIQIKRLKKLVMRRKNGEPIAHLTQKCEFWSLPLCISPITMIPRPDTECLVEQALIHLPTSSCRILDLGTGSGSIALALASERSDCQVIAIDILPGAVQLAKNNACRLKIKNVDFKQSNWFNALNEQKFFIIVSNPPYIDKKDPHLLQGDVRFEPKIALVSEEEGLADIRHIVKMSRQYLYSGGWLLIEHGWSQGMEVHAIFVKAGFQDVKTSHDYNGNDRLTFGRWHHDI